MLFTYHKIHPFKCTIQWLFSTVFYNCLIPGCFHHPKINPIPLAVAPLPLHPSPWQLLTCFRALHSISTTQARGPHRVLCDAFQWEDVTPESNSEGWTSLLSWSEGSISLSDTIRVRRGKPRALVLKRMFLLFYPEGGNRKKNLPPEVPITPMPRYSIMETPVLKKELDRLVLFWKACSEQTLPPAPMSRLSEVGSRTAPWALVAGASGWWGGVRDSQLSTYCSPGDLGPRNDTPPGHPSGGRSPCAMWMGMVPLP